MRKTINIAALLFFIWLLLDAFNIPDALLNFLLAGEIPVVRVAVPPTTMLALLTVATVVFIFEVLARRIQTVRRLRQNILGLSSRLERLQFRRVGRA